MDNPVLALLSSRRSVKPDRLLAARAEPQRARDDADGSPRAFPTTRSSRRGASSCWRATRARSWARSSREACIAEETEPPSEVRLAMERGRLMRAPLVIAVVSRVTPHRGAPEWEQILSAGAACFNLCLAANAMGYGTSGSPSGSPTSARVRRGARSCRRRAHRRFRVHRHAGRAAGGARTPGPLRHRHALAAADRLPRCCRTRRALTRCLP